MNVVGRLMSRDTVVGIVFHIPRLPETLFVDTSWFSQSFFDSGRPLLLNSGMTPEEVEELITNSKREVSDNKTMMYARVSTTWARKKAVETPA